MTKRVISQVQAAEMSFLQKVRGLSLLVMVKSTDIHQSLNIEPLLLHIEQLQLCWYDHVIQMSHKQTAKQLMDAFPSGKRPRGDPEFAGRIILKIWPGCILEFHQQNCH